MLLAEHAAEAVCIQSLLARHVAKRGHDQRCQHGQQLRRAGAAKATGFAEPLRRLIATASEDVAKNGATHAACTAACRGATTHRADHVTKPAAARIARAAAEHRAQQSADIDACMIALERGMQRTGALGRGRIAGKSAHQQWQCLLDGVAGLGGVDAELAGNRFDVTLVNLPENTRGQVAHDGHPIGVEEQKYHATRRMPVSIPLQASNIVTAACTAQIRARLKARTPPRAAMAMNKVDSRLDALHVRYRASLAGKRADIERATQGIRRDCRNPKSQDELLQLVHRLAGSAESYGFVEIGRTAAEADALLDDVRASRTGEHRADAMCAMLDSLNPLLEKLLSALQQAVEMQVAETDAASRSGAAPN
jgi:HPt (histidine-containing phosphotransfer) domain-containing protein